MSIKKQYLKSRPVCKVTFRLPAAAAENAASVYLVGDFNDWDTGAAPLRKLRDGTFSVTLDLEPQQEYQFRYLIDNAVWENDWDADKYVSSPYAGIDNSVVVL